MLTCLPSPIHGLPHHPALRLSSVGDPGHSYKVPLDFSPSHQPTQSSKALLILLSLQKSLFVANLFLSSAWTGLIPRGKKRFGNLSSPEKVLPSHVFSFDNLCFHSPLMALRISFLYFFFLLSSPMRRMTCCYLYPTQKQNSF